ncbi:MAG TPA: C40 family peptidase [Firmicutes bacterium]|nr:C40 family peptidase [Bacillota bacterium]
MGEGAAGSPLRPGMTVCVRESHVTLHRAPSAEAEVVTEARLGEVAEVRETSGGERAAGGPGGRGWLRVAMAHDGYTGWAPAGAWLPGSWPSGGETLTVRQLFANVYAGPRVQAPLVVVAPLGTPLRLLGPAGGEWLRVGLPGEREGFVQTGDVCRGTSAWNWETLPGLRRSLAETARRLLGLPYRWGGTTPWGIDCSGLVQLVYRLHGLILPRDACDQAKEPRTMPVGRDELQPGDLLFFARYGHVGLALSHWEFIHATTHETPVVQVSAVDDAYWTERRDEIRRLVPG